MIPVIVFSASMLVYVLTVAPTMSFFDSGEMIAGAFTLGVSHPPGYPVYITLGKLFTLLPLGNVAYRMNLMSGFFAAMTSVMVYYIARAMFDEEGEARMLPGMPWFKKFGIPEAVGIFSAFMFAFSFTNWSWAVASKFYTLNAFVASCIIMMLVRWRRARKDEGTEGGGHSMSYLYVVAFLCGIGGVVHISQFVLIPVYVLFILIVDWRVFVEPEMAGNTEGFPGIPAIVRGVQLKLLLTLVFFFMLGHSIYLHLPLRAAQEPLINWGAATNWEQFRWVYNREGYPQVGGERSLSLFIAQLKSFDLVREFTWAGLPLILVGLYGLIRKDWRSFVLVFGCAMFLSTVVVVMGNPPRENIFLLEQFYIPSYICLSVAAGGAAWLLLKGSYAGRWVAGLVFPFIFLGSPPMKYIESVLSGGKAASNYLGFMGIPYPPYLYFVFFAAIAAMFVVGVGFLQRPDRPAFRMVHVSIIVVLFVLYPSNQLRAHYWVNDRSENFIAYDMGNAELTFAPEFSVLFTWGDSGAFPMWYLQYVERKRPDVLLVHTPHLPLEWFLDSIRRDADTVGDKSQLDRGWKYLRNYNGIKGVEQFRKIPEDYRDPALMIQEMIDFNPDRPYAFDYSSRYSLKTPYEVAPYGITYRKPDGLYAEENLRTWPYLATRGLPKPSIALDLDETKAASIYGYVHADIGKKYMAMGLRPMSKNEFALAVKYSPELWNSVAPYMQ
ncbi:MAG: DUF2723 domain-containing protein [Nitrospirae bacterium]|nr:DUF2723 domain-containing protein [Nitrospirota bacterium]